MVSSLVGFIARRDNSVSWLEDGGCVYDAGDSITDEEIAAFVKSVDCYVMGSRTYEHALELGWPYGETPCLVLTRRHLQGSKENVEFHSGDLREFVKMKVAQRFRNVWLVGGAMLSQHFLEMGLVDEIRLTVAPVLLGDGLRLFGDLAVVKRWDLKNVRAYKNGFIELHYTASIG
jgi:dihydrofolate reductase